MNKILFLLAVFMPFGSIAQRIYIENNAFKVEGDSIFINGANTPWKNWNDLGNSFEQNWWDNHFAAMRSSGINSTRVWLTCNGGGGVEIDAQGYVKGPTEAFWKDMDSLMSIAKKHQIYIMGALISFDHTIEGNPKYKEWRLMYSSAAHMDSFIENYAVPLAKRYNNNPYFFSIDVCNEILWVSETEVNNRGNFPWTTIQYLIGKTAQRVHEESDVLVCVSNYIKYTSPKYNGNKYSDAALQTIVNHPKAYVDFYKVHYYPWVYPHFDGFHASHKPSHYGMGEKPCITGEISAHGIYNSSNKLVYNIKDCYELHHKNGWQGAMAWTSNGVDVNGDLKDLAPATLNFQRKYFHLVGQPHSARRPVDPAFLYAGRIDFTNLNAPKLFYAGSYVHTSFKGTSLKAVFSDHKSKIPIKAYFVIDSNITITKTIPISSNGIVVDVAEGLKDTIHSLYISKVEGPGAGAHGLVFHGLIIDNDTEIYSVKEPDLKIEFFGNSITEGVGSECETDGDCGANNAWYSYANLLSRMLNASVHNNGIGGLAVLDSTGWYQNKTTGLQTTYNKLIPANENGLNFTNWDFKKYKPKLVVFALGVNDANDPLNKAFSDTIEWKRVYKNVIGDVINQYGKDVKVIVAPGNINASSAYKYSKSVVDELKQQGFSIWYYQYTFETSQHPNKEEHIKMADELFDFIANEEILDNTNQNPVFLPEEKPSSVIKLTKRDAVHVYPTILDETNILTIEGIQHTDKILFNVYGIDGSIISDSHQMKFVNDQLHVQIKDLSPGIYILHGYNRDINFSARFIQK